ncbi:acyl-CoA dehydrogenase [Marivibrio halodurans]|uniref:Acyl-CoA dehydrogenase n=1 Tax=Marivibrio halodurans TaxID=2039722 RepID=A0A8J7RW13_9PROT|nr:acyl-CoA dehydrogenase [Marivibrio halodurans]MBP5855415.1 acyl-CoA dehydrogenase [Marivibrio halodurans]
MSADAILSERDIAFVLHELLDAEGLTRYARFAEHGRETFDGALATAQRIATEQFAPHNRKADLNEPRLVDGRVEIIPEVKPALESFAEAGFFAAHADFERGGMQLPWTVAQACYAWFQAANIGTFAYGFLTVAASNLLNAFATETQKARYMQPMLEGRFFGTMALSEPQAGSSLGDIRTVAEPDGEGGYRLKGGKMWISGGDHPLSENIVHLMLARLRDAPPGVKGLSLFIVPKYRLDAAGGPGPENGVALAGLNHKMGYRGTTNTVLDIGGDGPCHGELLGEPGQGLAYMFHMMNEARTIVGMSSAMLAYAGYRHALGYARERRQGRPVGAKDPAAPPARLIEHADVRRMLLMQKAIAEGGLALSLYAARLVDVKDADPDAEARREAHLVLEILTPIVKAYLSDRALEANDAAIQCLGGYGYTRDFPVEQYWRDNRLNPIHEGTNGIQAIDLAGRKVAMEEGGALHALAARIDATARAASAWESLAPWGRALGDALARLEGTAARLVEIGRGEGAPVQLANANAFMEMAGHLTLAWMHLKAALVAADALKVGAEGAEADFYRGKLHACRYVFTVDLPKTERLAALCESADRTALDMAEDWF